MANGARAWRTAASLALGPLVCAVVPGTTGCADPAGFLDASTVNALSKEEGDEHGTQRSGTYVLLVEDRDCGCDLEPGLEGLSLCSWVDLLGTVSGTPGVASVLVEATDGRVVLRFVGAPNAILVGSMQDGGQISAGAVTTLKTFVADGALITRVDGDFDRGADGDVFTGDIAHRVVGQASVQEVRPAVDCEERLAITGVPHTNFGP